MPKLVNRVPKYRKHRASGQAVVTIDGKDHYLGPHGTAVSKREYDRLVSEWLQNGRRAPAGPEGVAGLTVTELVAQYWQFAKGYYRKGGKPSGTLDHIKVALRHLKQTYGHTAVADFDPVAYKVVRQKMVNEGHSRGYVNRQCGHLARVFKWGVGEELVPPSVYHAIQAVPGLKKGRTEAPDRSPVAPLPEAVFQATLPYLPPIVADMARFQRFTGCRPAEVCILRPIDVDRSGEVWEYRPKSHKTEHHGRERVIYIGPKGQGILRPYLLQEADAYCFSPKEALDKHRAERHAGRRTPMGCGNRPGTNRRRRPKRKPGDRYTADSYRRAIHRAVETINSAWRRHKSCWATRWPTLRRFTPSATRKRGVT